MKRNIKIIIILLGLLTLAAAIRALIKGHNDTATYFGLFCALALIGTAIFSRTLRE